MAQVKFLKINSEGFQEEMDTASDDITLNTVEAATSLSVTSGVSIGSDITFNAVTDTIAGIQNQNLVDKTESETIAADWTVDTGYNLTLTDSPTADTHAVNKSYVDQLVQGIEWQDSVLDKDLTAPPGGETTGDRYIVGGSATGDWAGQDNNIAEYNGTGWEFTTTTEGMAAYVDDEDIVYVFNGTSWVGLGSTSTHNNLSGLQGGTTNEYYHLTSDEDAWVARMEPVSDYDANNNATFGSSAGATITTGTNNVIIGNGADVTASSNDNTITIGQGATSGNNSISVGFNATTDADGFVIGNQSSGTGTQHTIIGSLITGGATRGTHIGTGAGSNITATDMGQTNSATFIGNGAGKSTNFTGDAIDSGLTFIGYNAGSDTDGKNLIGVGIRNLDGVTGERNISIGDLSGLFTSGATLNDNILLGNYLFSTASGITGVERNILITGQSTISTELNFTGNETDNIIIGHGLDISSAGVTNELNIGGTIFGDLANDKIAIGGTTTEEALTVEGAIAIPQITAPTLSATYGKFYTKSDDKPYFMDTTGTEYDLTDNGTSYSDSVQLTLTAATGGIAQYDAVYISGNDEVGKADATALSTAKAIGFAPAAITAAAQGLIQVEGVLSGVLTGATAGTPYFLQTTAGTIGTTKPTGSGNVVMKVGYAINATDLFIEPELMEIRS